MRTEKADSVLIPQSSSLGGSMLIIDAHLDLSWNALQWGRDLRRSVYTIRTQENTLSDKGRGLGTVAFPEMRQGRVALSFATLLARSTGQPVPQIDFATP